MEKSIPIVCPYCGVGCNLELLLNEQGSPVKSSASGRNADLNGKYLCVKGLSVHELYTAENRLSTPLVRKKGRLEKATWDEALSTAADGLKRVIARYGAESVGMLSSSKILNEEIYLSQKFQRMVIGNNNVDNCARLCHGPSEVGLRRHLGIGAVSVFLEDYDEAETVVLVGAHTTATHPVIWMRLRKNVKKRGLKLILADPRDTDLVKYSTLNINPRPGTDIFWIKALGRIMYEKGWYDESFCRRHTLGFRAYVESLSELDVEEACRMSGVERKDLEEAAELIHGKKTIFIWGMGLTQHAHGTDNVSALVNLVLLTGNIGKPGCGVAPLRGQNNVQGAGDMGALPNLLPGHMYVDDEAARIHTGAVWGGVVPTSHGLAAPEMIHEIASGKIRALYVIGENPVMSEPQSTFVSWMLQRLDMLIVQDVFPTDTSSYAHVVLPAAMVGEKEGTMTNAARRIQYSGSGLKTSGDVRPDWWIIQDMAAAMGHTWNYSSTEEIWEEIRSAAPVFCGVTHKRLKESEGVFWPCYDENHPGTPRLYLDGFIFNDRRARFIPVSIPERLMVPTDDYPYILITGRLLEHFNTGEMSRRSGKLLKITGESFTEMNEIDAAREGLNDGDLVRVTSPFGTINLKLQISDSIPAGALFAPIHFNNPNLNSLMSAVPMDPKARMPALKVVPVNIEREGR